MVRTLPMVGQAMPKRGNTSVAARVMATKAPIIR